MITEINSAAVSLDRIPFTWNVRLKIYTDGGSTELCASTVSERAALKLFFRDALALLSQTTLESGA